MKHHYSAYTAMALLVGFAACSSATDTTPIETDPPIDDTWTDEESTDHGVGTLNPVLEGRAPKRLTVDQLRRVVPQLTDGHTWIETTPYLGTQFIVPMFELLGPTLGEADYLTQSVNFLDPIPSFMKYVEDMASTVCVYPVLFDAGNDSIKKYPEDVDRTLRYLRLKFHGVYVPEGSTDGIAELRTLYDTLETRYADDMTPGHNELKWIGVCVALMTDPEFFIY